MPPEILPTFVLDPRDAAHWGETIANQQTVVPWLREQGLDPEKLIRVEVYDVNGLLYAHVSEILFDEEGLRYCRNGHEFSLKLRAGPNDRHLCDVATRTYLAPLTAMPASSGPDTRMTSHN